MCMRASVASKLRKCQYFYILKLLFLSIFCRYIGYFVGTNYILVGLRDGHTIATTSRRPLTTTIFGVVAGGCRRSANVCRWSVTGCQRITSTTSRRPPTTTLFPGGFRWSANGCWWSPSSFGRPEVFDAASTTIDNQTRLPYKMNIHLILKNADDGEIEEE